MYTIKSVAINGSVDAENLKMYNSAEKVTWYNHSGKQLAVFNTQKKVKQTEKLTTLFGSVKEDRAQN